MSETLCCIPGCRNVAVTEDRYCVTHDTQWDRDDMQMYRLYREDGYTHYQAAVIAGLIDPEH